MPVCLPTCPLTRSHTCPPAHTPLAPMHTRPPTHTPLASTHTCPLPTCPHACLHTHHTPIHTHTYCPLIHMPTLTRTPTCLLAQLHDMQWCDRGQGQCDSHGGTMGGTPDGMRGGPATCGS